MNLYLAIGILLAVAIMVCDAILISHHTDMMHDVMMECVTHNTYQECQDDQKDRTVADDIDGSVVWLDDEPWNVHEPDAEPGPEPGPTP